MKSLGMKIPRVVDDRIRKEIRALDVNWEIRASKNHYFLYVDNKNMACVGNLGGRNPDFRAHKLAITTMRRNLRCI